MRTLLPLVLLAGCQADGTDETATEAPSCETGDSQLVILRVLTWARIDDNNLSPGFDLDGDVTADGDNDGCGVQDYTSPEGVAGVDNAFGRLLPTLEVTEFSAVEGLIAQAIASGELMLTLQVDHLDAWDSPRTDSCVDLTVGRATGTPLLGTDGLLESGQTVEPYPDGPTAVFPDVAVTNDHLEVRGLTMQLPITVFDVTLDFAIHDGALSLDWNEDGSFSGVFGGAVDVEYIIGVASSENVDPDLVGIISALLEVNSDLDTIDGVECGAVSINFEFEGIPAYFYDL